MSKYLFFNDFKRRALILCFALSLFAHVHAQYAVDAKHAALFGALPMQSHEGRMEPVNTFSSEVLRKLHHATRIDSLNSDRFLLSILALPETWKNEPFIFFKNRDIARKYGFSEGKLAYNETFDDTGNYRLQNDLDIAFRKPPQERTRFDKDLIKLDEQINIVNQLINGNLLTIFPIPDANNHPWLALNPLLDTYLESVRQGMKTGDWQAANANLEAIRTYQKAHTTLIINERKISIELLYNKLNIFSECRKIYLVFGGVLLFLSFLYLFRRKKLLKLGILVKTIFVSAGLAYHLFGIALRWYIAGYAPWSNAYETMIYVSFITVLAGLFFVRRSTITLALAALFGGVILFVSGLNWMDPQITPLMPVLKSPWLMIHVAVVVASYGFFGVSFLIGLVNLILIPCNSLKGRNSELGEVVNRLTIINEISLLIGLALMTAGTFLGAVWANEAWGRYWAWDPKETWALITIIVYACVCHIHLIKVWNKQWLFNLLSVIAFASVLMTYFGVNYFLSGLHSYGG